MKPDRVSWPNSLLTRAVVSRVPSNILADRVLREGVEAHSLGLAKDPQRFELFLTKNRDDPLQDNPPPFPEMHSAWMNVCRSMSPMDIIVEYTLPMHYDPILQRLSRRPRSHSVILGITEQVSGSWVAQHVFPNRRLCERVQAEPVAPAVDLYRREFLLTKNGDDPLQSNTARSPEQVGVDESIRPSNSRQ